MTLDTDAKLDGMNNEQWISDDGSVRLILGDCLEVLPTLPRVDAVVTDPPYGTTQSDWDLAVPLENLWPLLSQVTHDDSPVVLFGAEPFSSMLRASNWDHWRYDWIWEKSRPTRFLDSKRMPLVAHELISVFGKSRPRYFPQMTAGEASHGGGQQSKATSIYNTYEHVSTKSNGGMQYPRSVIKFPSIAPGAPHPNQKPLQLIEYLVNTYTQSGDSILDFTFGSGTTGVACVRLGRKFIGIEKEPKYFEIAKRRIQDELSRNPLFEKPAQLKQRDLLETA